MPRADEAGRVWLVGAGPGDPDLMTVRAVRVLSEADVVLVDHLVPRAVLDGLTDDVEVIDVGKRPGNHAMSQECINALLVEKALAGLNVVRLKGGDPFVFGRGGEEALACAAAGVRVDVVPGVTSSVAVPAAAGIPVTHRGITNAFTVLSGHDAADAIDDPNAGRNAHPTLVVLMATKTLPNIVASLLLEGRSPDTPVAIIERGWTPSQRTIVGTLADIVDVAVAARVRPPAVVVIGEVVSLRNRLGDLGAVSAGAGHLPARNSPSATRAH